MRSTHFARRRIWPWALPVLWLVFWLCAPASKGETFTYYVAPGGSDAWSGHFACVNRSKTDGPLATLQGALEKSRKARRKTPAAEARIILRGGTYSLSSPLALTPGDSGLTLKAYDGEKPVITSEARLTGWRTLYENPNVWSAHVSKSWRFHELFFNGNRRERTRWPATGFFNCVGGPNEDHPGQLQFQNGDVKADWARDGAAELVLLQAWAQSRNRMESVDEAASTVSLAGDAFPNHSEKNPRYYIENADIPLCPGQWRLDEKTGVVTCWPEAGEDLASANITAPQLYDLVLLEGEEDRPIRNITFEGLEFAGTDWRLTGGSDIDTQAAVEVEAAVQARFARRCAIFRCRFTHLGGYAVDFGHGCQNNRIVGCEMWDLGGGGVRLGDTSLQEAQTALNLANDVTDNHIHHLGLVHAPAVGVLVFLSANNLIARNEIDHTFYTAISVGWSWGYKDTPCDGNIVEYNHLHDIGQGMLSDMGGVYTLGVQPGTIIVGNLIHDVSVYKYGGWGLYTDEGSSDMVLENNIVYRCQSAGFHQHYGENNLLYNNIFALNRDYQLMRTRAEPHRSFTFTNNIVYFDSGKLLGGNWSGDGFVMDHNLYFDTRLGPARSQSEASKFDPHARGDDPLFIAPQRGDFRLRRTSPALAFGFHPLDLRDCGPRRQFAAPP